MTKHRDHLEARFAFLVEKLRTSEALAVFRLGDRKPDGRGALPLGFLVPLDALEEAKRTGSLEPDVEGLASHMTSLERLAASVAVSHMRAHDLVRAVTTTEQTEPSALLERIRTPSRPENEWHWLPASALADELERLAPALVEEMAADMRMAAEHFVHESIRDEVLAHARDAAEWWPFPSELGDLDDALRYALRRELEPRRGTMAPEGYVALTFARWLAPALESLVPQKRRPSFFPPGFDVSYERAPSPSGPWEAIDDDELPILQYGPLPVPQDGTGEAVEHEGRWYRWTPIPPTTLAAELVLQAEHGALGFPQLVPSHPTREGDTWNLPGEVLARLHLAELEVRRAAFERVAHEVASEDAEGLDAEKAAEALAREVREAAHQAAEVIGFTPATTTLYELRALHIEGEPYPLDVRAAAWLRSLGGDKAKEAADALAGASHKRDDWWDHPYKWPRVLATVLWRDVVRPRLERVAGRSDSAGLAYPVLGNLVAISRRGAQLDAFDNERAVILDRRKKRMGSIEAAPHLAAEHTSLDVLGKLNTQRLIRWALWQGYERWCNDAPDPGRFYVEGGFESLARELGLKGRKAASELRAAAHILGRLHVVTPTGEGQVFACHLEKPGPGKPARLEIVLLGPFAPGYISDRLTSQRGLDKALVPVPLPRMLPPLVGDRRNEYGAQALLQLLALRELRLNCEELAERGSVEIHERRWRELADEAGVPSLLLPDILNAYPQGNRDAPPFLERPATWRFALSDAYDLERKTILAAARSQAGGRAGGRLKAAKQRERLEGLALAGAGTKPRRKRAQKSKR